MAVRTQTEGRPAGRPYRSSGGSGALLQVVLELPAPRRVAQLAQRLGLDLPDPLASHVEVAPDLLEGPRPTILQAKPELQHAPLARRQGVQHALHLLLEELMAGGIRGGHGRQVRDEVAQVAVLLLADGRLEADRLLADLHDLAHLLGADALRALGLALVDLALGGLALQLLAQLADDLVAAHAPRDLLDGRLAPQLLQQGALDPDQAVDGLHHVDRDADGPRLVRDGPRDGLPDPPRGVGAELEALLVLELLDRPDEADVPLLDKVQEAHAAPDVLFGDADHQAQVGFGQTLAGVDALLDQPPGSLFRRSVCRNARVVAQLAQVHGVVAVLDVRPHDVLGRFACPALELDQLGCPGVVERSEPIAMPEQDGVLERSSRS